MWDGLDKNKDLSLSLDFIWHIWKQIQDFVSYKRIPASKSRFFFSFQLIYKSGFQLADELLLKPCHFCSQNLSLAAFFPVSWPICYPCGPLCSWWPLVALVWPFLYPWLFSLMKAQDGSYQGASVTRHSDHIKRCTQSSLLERNATS